LETGSSIESELHAFPKIGDLNPTNNQRNWTQQVQGSTTIPAPVAPLTTGKAKHTGELLQVHTIQPNPFRANTQFVFDLAQSETVRLQIFDLSGQLLMDVNQNFAKGRNEWQIDGEDLQGAGMLIYRLETSKESKVGKMMKL